MYSSVTVAIQIMICIHRMLCENYNEKKIRKSVLINDYCHYCGIQIVPLASKAVHFPGEGQKMDQS